VKVARAPRVLFAFMGGAGAWPGMGAQLYEEEPAFRATVDRASDHIEERMGFSMAAAIVEGRPESEDRAQAHLDRWVRLGIIQLALCDLWRANGVTPDGVVGFSLGDWTSAYAAGVLTCEETVGAMFAGIGTVAGHEMPGLIFSVEADLDVTRELCETAPTALDVLGTTSPTHTMAFSSLELADENRRHITRGAPISSEHPIDFPGHNWRRPWPRAMVSDAHAGVPVRRPSVPIYSSVTGGALPEHARLDADYWLRMVAQPFYFSGALSAALADGYDVVVNVGAHAFGWTLEINEFRGGSATVVDSMRRGEPQQITFANALQQVRAHSRPSRLPGRRQHNAVS
jgi:polyketide synthase 12